MTPSRVEVEGALAEVLDPEYPVSLVDMGMIREVEVADGTARVAISRAGCFLFWYGPRSRARKYL